MGNEYFNKAGKIVTYFVLMFTWFHFRFIAFFQSVFIYIFRGRLAVDNYTNIVTVIAFLLSMLLALNLYWFVLFMKMGYGLMIRKKKVGTKTAQVLNKSTRPN